MKGSPRDVVLCMQRCNNRRDAFPSQPRRCLRDKSRTLAATSVTNEVKNVAVRWCEECINSVHAYSPMRRNHLRRFTPRREQWGMASGDNQRYLWRKKYPCLCNDCFPYGDSCLEIKEDDICRELRDVWIMKTFEMYRKNCLLLDGERICWRKMN